MDLVGKCKTKLYTWVESISAGDLSFLLFFQPVFGTPYYNY